MGSYALFVLRDERLGHSLTLEEIWLYDTATKTLSRVTVASGDHLGSGGLPSLSADGTKIAFHSEADFLNQGLSAFQFEIWVFESFEVAAKIYLLVIGK